jgi:hypothetical protein
MGIVVAVLGVIIIALSLTLFLVDKKEPIDEAVPVTEIQNAPFIVSEEMVEVSATTTPGEEVPEENPTPAVVPEASRTEEMTMQEEAPVSIQPAPTPAVASGQTYSEKVSYLTPARTEHKLNISLTVAAGVVTGASIVYDEGAGFSNGHQERFDNAYKAQVVGKSLENISLSRVGGASLTSEAFNKAVATIAAKQS